MLLWRTLHVLRLLLEVETFDLNILTYMSELAPRLANGLTAFVEPLMSV